MKDMSNRIGIWTISLLCVFHFLFLLKFFAPAISTPDAQGYFTQGRIIATHGQTFFTPQNNVQYIGSHWYSQDGQKYYTTFPPGFPCLIAIAYKLFGAKSTFLVNPILASVSLLIFFFLCKNWLSNSWSLVAVFLLAINPFYNEHALFGDSHTSVVFFFLVALLFLMKAIKTDNWIYGIISGLAIGVVPAIRYAEFVLCIVFSGYIFWQFHAKQLSLRTCVSSIVGIVIVLTPLAVRNQIAFGKFWITGYSQLNTQALFGFNYLIEHFIPFIMLLVTAGMGILFLFSIGGFVRLLKDPNTKSIGIYFLLSISILILTYMAYFWPPDPQTMRFLLPTFPIYTIAAVYFISQLKGKYQIVYLSIALLVSLPWGVSGSLRAVKSLKARNSVLANITRYIERKIKAGNIIITYEGICQNLDLLGKWKLIDMSILAKADPLMGQRPMKPMRNEYASKVYDSLHGDEFKKQLIKDLSQWSAKRIFLIAYESEIGMLSKLIDDRLNVEKKWSIEMSDFPVLEFIFERRVRTMPDRPRANRPDVTGPNRIFDFEIRKEPLIIVELTRRNTKDDD
ncbi:hypothetical protein DRP98_00140 [candidate division KSB1 bacterium]|nr:MAG: hypothetical protein DRP98_00140 [candidate division KSB1 bacterium]